MSKERKNVQGLLGELVSYPILGGQSNLSIITFIQEYLESYGIPCQLVPNKENTKASLHCRIGPPVDGGIILSGHTDVVPVEGQNWQSDPFQLEARGGKLYGRGTCDIKGFLACCLASIPKMVKTNLKKPIYFAFSYDEEIGCLAGPALAKAIKTYYEEIPRFAIIGEPTLLHPVSGQKGKVELKIHVNGSAGHSSRIKEEVSAIHEATRLITWLEGHMDQLIQSGQTDNRFSPNHTSLHVGMIQGGIAPNIVADSCTFYVDIRNIPKDDLNLIIQSFNRFCKERTEILKKAFPGFKIEIIEHHPPIPPLDTTLHSPIIPFIIEIANEEISGGVSFATEAGQFAVGGFESVICGPGSVTEAHRANEFITIEQLEKGLAFIHRLIKKLC